MFRLIILLGIALSTCAIPALSAPLARASWDPCDFSPLSHATAQPGLPYNMIFSVVGIDMHHEAYRIRLRYGRSGGGPIPDAWRFDSQGCQPSDAFRIDFFGPRVGTQCFDLTFGQEQVLQSGSVVLDPASGRISMDLEADYPPGFVETSIGQRFFMARINFDQYNGIFGASSGTQCGGLEEPMCFFIESIQIKSNGTWIEIPIEEQLLTASGPGVPVEDCTAVPARSTTWGAIRAAWR